MPHEHHLLRLRHLLHVEHVRPHVVLRHLVEPVIPVFLVVVGIRDRGMSQGVSLSPIVSHPHVVPHVRQDVGQTQSPSAIHEPAKRTIQESMLQDDGLEVGIIYIILTSQSPRSQKIIVLRPYLMYFEVKSRF